MSSGQSERGSRERVIERERERARGSREREKGLLPPIFNHNPQRTRTKGVDSSRISTIAVTCT